MPNQSNSGEARFMICAPSPSRHGVKQLISSTKCSSSEPDDWKPVNTVGQGVREIRIRDEAGAFRVVYIAKLADAVYELHCFQKKTQRTSKTDLDIAAKRYRELLKETES
jgi:phage-related protein